MLSELVTEEIKKRDEQAGSKFAKKFKIVNHYFGY